MPALKMFKRSEIASRNSQNDAVFIIDNVVYDITKFLDEHPGGHEVLINASGKDASEAFADIGHSLDAKELMKKFVIGEVVEEDRRELEKRQVNWVSDSSGQQQSEGFTLSWKIPVLVGLVLSLLYKFVLSE